MDFGLTSVLVATLKPGEGRMMWSSNSGGGGMMLSLKLGGGGMRSSSKPGVKELGVV